MLSTLHLLVVEDDRGRREISLVEEMYLLGRDVQCNIRLFSLFVSRRHATLIRRQREDGSYCYQILDGNGKGKLSAGGMLINGRKLQVHDLNNEDEILFCPGVQLKYYQVSEP